MHESNLKIKSKNVFLKVNRVWELAIGNPDMDK